MEIDNVMETKFGFTGLTDFGCILDTKLPVKISENEKNSSIN
uniref:Uncharacterized protein n=1 Tax=Tetranychus urticae TaxID=32264 RepID=T1L2U5_TETUR